MEKRTPMYATVMPSGISDGAKRILEARSRTVRKGVLNSTVFTKVRLPDHLLVTAAVFVLSAAYCKRNIFVIRLRFVSYIKRSKLYICSLYCRGYRVLVVEVHKV